MGFMRLRRGWLSWLESHEMDVYVYVHFEHAIGSNAYLVVPIDLPQTQAFDSISHMLESPFD
jgi:hypothetical protein